MRGDMERFDDIFLLEAGATGPVYVFGLTWFPLVGSHIQVMARMRAR